MDEFRDAGYLPDALFNFLALLGWAPDGETTILSRDEIVERFSLDRVGASPATFDYAEARLAERRLPRARSARTTTPTRSSPTCASRGSTGTRSASGRRRRSCRRRSRGFGEFPASPASSSARSSRTRRCSTAAAPCWRRPPRALAGVEPFAAEPDRGGAEGGLAERLELKPRQAFQPIRVAVTGSKVSPGLYESLELLGKDESLRRLSAASRRLAERPGRRQRVERALEHQPGTRRNAIVGDGSARDGHSAGASRP